jgi:NADH-quinone oxidoreductase subunit N
VTAITSKLWFIVPELILFAGVVVAFLMGLSKRRAVRDLLPLVTCATLAAAFVVTPLVYRGARLEAAIESGQFLMPVLGKYVKMAVALVGVLLTLVGSGMVDRRLEADVQSGRVAFDPLRASRGEFHAFFLLSLMGVMLCASANDLIWLFLALELTSLPTYVMVAISSPLRRAQEAAVKYFFLGAMAAAMFLFGFALLYGATGTIVLTEMRESFTAQRLGRGEMGVIGTIGMILSILGIAYKIAAAPMHFYAADVYEGAASPVTAFLGFVPKTAGMLALMLLLGTLGWEGWGPWADASAPGLPQPILTTLWMLAALTMTLGNVGALLQRSVKRMLAYSSIAHSGYIVIGLIAGPGDGLNAVLFYLLVYGLMNTGAFAVLAGLERRGQEIESVDDIAGLRQRHPAMAAALSLCAGSLLGFPPLLGFIGKLYLFIAGFQAGQWELVVVAAVNSAISAWYYLYLVKLSMLEDPSPRAETIVRGPAASPRVAAIIAAIAVVVLPLFTTRIIEASGEAAGTQHAAGAEAPAVTRRP